MKKLSPIAGQAEERVSLFTITKDREEAADIEKYPVKFKSHKRDFFSINGLEGLEIKYHNVIDLDEFSDNEDEKLIIVFHDNSFCLIGCPYTTRLIDVLTGDRLAKLGFVSQSQGLKIDKWHNAKRLTLLKNRALNIAESIKHIEALL